MKHLWTKQILKLTILWLMITFCSTLAVYAAPPASLNDVNTYLFADTVNDARSYRLIKTIQPDMIHRGIYEWTGTPFSDRNWEGATGIINELQQSGSFIVGGVSGFMWDPDRESGPAIVDQATKDRCSIPNSGSSGVRKLNIAETTALDQLIYKAKKHIDAGANAIEFDEFGADWPDYNYVKTALSYIRTALKNYAQTQYGRDVYITANSAVGGQNFLNFTGSSNDGSEPVDLYIRNLPYRLVGLAQNNPDSTNDYDGTYNFIPSLRQAHSNVWPKRFYYFVDFGATTSYWAPHKTSQWANFYRISSAQVIAAGGFPGNMLSFYRNLDSLEMGTFQYVANIHKFMKENSELWRNLSFINPTVTCSTSNIFTSTFGQSGRTILHLVNGNFNNTTQTMTAKNNFTVTISLDSAPTNIWMTTPDKPSKDRKTPVTFTYDSQNKTATLQISALEFHNVLVIEQGSAYNPVYAPLEVKFPFPVPTQLYAGNKLSITAVATDGYDGIFTWYVNDIAGGNSSVGTIDSQGNYTAPSGISSPLTVTIKAVSRVDTARSTQATLTVMPAAGLPWNSNFAADSTGSIPGGWNIVDGRGDWTISMDGSEKVLSNNNITEGNGNGDARETALFAPMIAAGDQMWTDYEFSADVKWKAQPIRYYTSGVGSYAAFVFRYQDSKNYYFYTLEADQNARLYKCYQGTITEIGGGRFAGTLSTDAYTHVRIQVRGNEFKLMVGPRLVRTDTDTSFTRGAVGFKASYTSSNYKNVRVEGLGVLEGNLVDGCSDFSKIYSKSQNLSIDTSNVQYLGGDGARISRSQAAAEWVTYAVNGQGSAAFTTYFWAGEAISHFSFFTSTDGANWSPATPDIQIIQATNPYWHKVTYNLSIPGSTIKYIKVQWQNLTGQSWSPQLGQVELKDKLIINAGDTCSTLPQLRSSNIGIDSSNSQNFGGDANRFFRTSGSQPEWIAYAYDNLRSATVNAYFWPGENISHFRFYLSKDNTVWEEVTPWISQQTATDPNWNKVTYVIDGVTSGYRYIKIVWQNLSGQSWTPQIGDVSISYAGGAPANAGFEEGSAQWSLPGEFTITTADKNSGNSSLKLSATGSNHYAYQILAVNPNTNYVLSFYAKGNKQNWCKILTTSDATVAEIKTLGNNTWTRYTVFFNSGNNQYLKIYIGDNGETTSGVLYFDDFVVE